MEQIIVARLRVQHGAVEIPGAGEMQQAVGTGESKRRSPAEGIFSLAENRVPVAHGAPGIDGLTRLERLRETIQGRPQNGAKLRSQSATAHALAGKRGAG